MIGGIGPDGSACPLVNDVNTASGWEGKSHMDYRIQPKLNIVQGLSIISVFTTLGR